MSRSRIYQEHKPKMKVVQVADDLVTAVMKALCNEKIYPKRSRWLLAGKIADTANEFFQYLNTANEIKVKTPEEARDRHRYQTLARAALETMDLQVTLAKAVLDIDVDRLKHYGDLFAEEHHLLLNWISKDERRYASLL